MMKATLKREFDAYRDYVSAHLLATEASKREDENAEDLAAEASAAYVKFDRVRHEREQDDRRTVRKLRAQERRELTQ